jgi:hypothetical protein
MFITIFKRSIAFKSNFKLERVFEVGRIIQYLNVEDIDKRHGSNNSNMRKKSEKRDKLRVIGTLKKVADPDSTTSDRAPIETNATLKKVVYP